ncbi:MAG: STAS domain-containing protein [Ignavibacteria bacterium]|nr:STAS domain-containing protein [Ignavibacteria bacterium]MBT8381303.1 STAS domain-containing protein [Ignavibacteria bacterium]MBT8390814.1 STAS domain-containing protein [Ignavibacteria bacterium]NNJ53291.1 STAS domain-containing protein [Ignavibacteriaceae bacterium]NNL20857.1 STAS domain-containing protein [Ignavibacteriaceae bacterium]
MKELEKKYHCGFLIANVHLKKATILEALDFKSEIDKEIEKGQHNVVVNLSSCEFLDSTFIGVLVVTWKKLKARGGKLKLVKPGNFAKSVFHLTGAIEIFETYESIEEALSSFVTPIEDYEVDLNFKQKFN